MADPITAAIVSIGFEAGAAGFYSLEAFLVFNAATIASVAIVAAPCLPTKTSHRHAVEPRSRSQSE